VEEGVTRVLGLRALYKFLLQLEGDGQMQD
jgi:hypothetical protein